MLSGKGKSSTNTVIVDPLKAATTLNKSYNSRYDFQNAIKNACSKSQKAYFPAGCEWNWHSEKTGGLSAALQLQCQEDCPFMIHVSIC